MRKLKLVVEEVENGYLIREDTGCGRGTIAPIWVAKNHADLSGIIVQLAAEAGGDDEFATDITG